ncbi:MAG TPA: AI-2E family transporter [Opitutae bacterium]|nr:AI-2E family transporter [Opitutae bacterium]|tara:strand:- start:8948 stop:10006 length:1059 start_codon:yes stop_codon:yes gene_type:complete
MKIIRLFLTIFAVVLAFYLLNLGQALLLPLVIAGAIAYIINILAHVISRISIRSISLPKSLSMVLAVTLTVISITFTVQLITENVARVLQKAPGYQENLEARIFDLCNRLGFQELPSLGEMLSQFDLSGYLLSFGSMVSALVSSMGIIIIYLIFILLEQRTFSSKIRALFSQKSEQEDAFDLINQINQDIGSYIGIKFVTSTATGIVSYLVLQCVGVDFAGFWAVLIFLLNFIPTIGSIIATAFPSLLALVQFENLAPFIITISILAAVQFCIGSLIEPKLMGNRLNLSPLVILLSLGLWGAIWGIAGMFLCVPITVIIMIICAYFPETRGVAVALSSNGELPVGPRRSSRN